MSGIYNPANTSNDQIFTEGKGEFGLHVFSDPNAQATFKNVEDAYKKMLTLKDAYDKQELMRRMRTDMKREYLTRKNQVAQLQRNAAVEFRNAEFSLQEHYATQAADGGDSPQYHHGVRAVNISDPLVSQIHLPIGETLDLKEFDKDAEFAKVREFHEHLRLNQQQQRQQENSRAWFDQTPSTCDDECVPERRRSAFGGCYDYTEEELLQHDEDEDILNSDNKWNLPMTAAEKMVLEKGEAAQNQQTEDPGCHYTFINTHDAIDQAGWLLRSIQERAPTIGMTDEECEAYYQELRRVAYEAASPVSDEDEDEEEQMRREAQFQEYYLQHMENEEREAMEIPDVEPIPDEPEATGSGAIADSKSKKQSVKIVKPHQQKRKQPKKKFVPLQITLNPNHEAANKLADAVIVNLSNRSIRTHSKKREAEKWNRINAEHKQCAARGTRITNILHEDSD